jgi:hypothetical protein
MRNMTDDPLKRNKLRRQREKKMEKMKKMRERAKEKKKNKGREDNNKEEKPKKPKEKEEEEDEDHYLEKHDPIVLLRKRDDYFKKEKMLQERKQNKMEKEILQLNQNVPEPLDDPVNKEDMDPIFFEYEKLQTTFEGNIANNFSKEEMQDYMNTLFLQKKKYLYQRAQMGENGEGDGPTQEDQEVDKRIEFLQSIHTKKITLDDKSKKKPRNDPEHIAIQNNTKEEEKIKEEKAKILSSGHGKVEISQTLLEKKEGNKTIFSAQPEFNQEYLEFTAQRDDFVPVAVLKNKGKK